MTKRISSVFPFMFLELQKMRERESLFLSKLHLVALSDDGNWV